MIALVVSVNVVPGRMEEFLDAMRENSARSVGDEPGCLSFDVTQDVADDHHFLFYELYRDQAAVDAHRAAPHFAAWRAAAARCLVPGSQVNTLATQRFHHRKTDS